MNIKLNSLRGLGNMNDYYLLVLGLRGPRALGEEAILIAGSAGDGCPAADAGILIEQGHRAEFRYRIIVRRVNCTVRVHCCG